MTDQTTPWDAIVLGAGPAGSLAARQLARGGARVLLLEKKVFPRPKVCGACLNQHAIEVLNSVGLAHIVGIGIPVHRLQVGLNGRSASLPLPTGVAISRSSLDLKLLQEAELAGATVRQGTSGSVLDIDGEVRQVRITSGDQISTESARLVIAATGLGTSLSASEPLKTTVTAQARLGASCVVSEFPEHYHQGSIFMAVGRNGYVGLTRVSDDELNIAAAFDGPFLRTCGSPSLAAAQVLREAGFPAVDSMSEASWMGTLPLTRTTRPVALARLLLVGDATGYVEPFTGEGMAWALVSGWTAANLWLRDPTARPMVRERLWIREFERRIGRRQSVCRGLATILRHPLAAGAAFEIARVLPSLAGLLVTSVNRPPILT